MSKPDAALIPHSGVIPPDHIVSREFEHDVKTLAVPLRRVVSIGSRVLGEIVQRLGAGDIDIRWMPLAGIYRDVLCECIAVRTLEEGFYAPACISNIRSAYEKSLAIQKMCECKSGSYALAYKYCNYIYQIRVATRCREELTKSQGHRGRSVFSKVHTPSLEDVEAEISHAQDRCRDEVYSEVSRILRDRRGSGNSKRKLHEVKWYELDRSCRSIRKLAAQFGWGKYHDIVYGDWSRSTHGGAGMAVFVRDGDSAIF